MQHFHLDHGRGRRDEQEPLFDNSFGDYQSMGAGKSGAHFAEDEVGHGYFGRWEAWWHSRSPTQRQKIKRTAVLSGVAVGLLLALLLILLGRPSGSSTTTTVSTTTSPAPPSPSSPSPSPSPPPPTAQVERQSPPPDAGPPPPSPPPPESPPAPPPPSPESPPPPPPSPGPPGPPAALQQDPEALCNSTGLYLPDTMWPVRYDLNFSVNLPKNITTTAGATPPTFRVDGQVAISVRVGHATNCLVLHSSGINITTVAFQPPASSSGPAPPPVPGQVISSNNDTQQVVLRFTEPLPMSPSVALKGVQQPMGPQGADDTTLLGQLLITYTYDVISGLDGFYYSTYVSEANSTVQNVIASTQFESLSARKAFPCWDEPRFKAVVSLTIAAPPDLVVLANMPQDPASTPLVVRPDGLAERRFLPSPPLSTYLVAWVLGGLAAVRNDNCVLDTGAGTTATVPVAVWATPNRVHMLNDSLDVACASLQRYTSLLGVMYFMPKLDLVGIPDFAAGAMENAGLITFKETYLLVDSANYDILQYIDVGTVVAHEISHQWFGDLVTCADWNELWLNEGFATYFMYLGADAWRPDFEFLQQQFFTSSTILALQRDSLATNHPLSSTKQVSALSEVDQYFDSISYEKGGAVLRMLRSYLSLVVPAGAPFETPSSSGSMQVPATGAVKPLPFTATNVTLLPLRRHRNLLHQGLSSAGKRRSNQQQEEVDLSMSVTRPTWKTEPFMAALKVYLEKYQYGVATTPQLLSIMQNVTGLPVESWMSGWVYDSNHPVLHVDHVTAQGSTATLALRQAPIVSTRQCGVVQENQTAAGSGKWWLPVLAADVSALQPSDDGALLGSSLLQAFSVDACNSSITVSLNPQQQRQAPQSPEAIALNVGRYGFFRVNYTSELWASVALAASNASQVSSQDMAGLLSDSYFLTEQAQLGIQPFLAVLSQLGPRAKAEQAPWAVASVKVQRILQLLSNAALNDDDSGLWTTCRDDFLAFIRNNITGPAISNILGTGVPLDYKVNTSGDSLQLRMTRPYLLALSGRANDTNTLLAAEALVQPLEDDVEAGNVATLASLDADTRLEALCNNLRAGDQSTRLAAFESTKTMYLNSTSPLERDVLLHALGCVVDGVLQAAYLRMLATPDVRLQDVQEGLYVLGNQGGKAFAQTWTMMFENFDMIVSRWPDQGSATYSLGLAVKQLAGLFTDTSAEADMQQFFQKYKRMLDPEFLTFWREQAEKNAAWLAATGPQLCAAVAGGAARR